MPVKVCVSHYSGINYLLAVELIIHLMASLAINLVPRAYSALTISLITG